MKPIKLTQSSIAKAKKDLFQQLDHLKLQNSRFTFSYDFSKILEEQLKKDVKRPIVYMTATTYLKMLEYVLQSDTEIAWHGTVKRGTGAKKHIFLIKDVYLYPQIVAGATVKTDDTKYTQWSDQQDTETFNNRRFQGHSHVNMSTAYSGVDDENQNAFLQDLSDNDFYIFLVTNKRQEHNLRIYDLAQNILFENKDIDFRIYLDENTLIDTVKEEINKNCEKTTYKWPDYKQYRKDIDQYDFNDYFNSLPIDDYYNEALKNGTIKRYIVLLNRKGRNFEKEYPEYEGDVINTTYKNKLTKIFIPFIPFETFDITKLKQEGWHIEKMDVPAEYNGI